MTKQEFVDRVAQKANIGKREAGDAVEAFLDSITDALRNGEEVTFTGFGKFSVQNRAARQGVNPRNPSERVHIPASKVPKFSAGSKLKTAVKTTNRLEDAAEDLWALPGDPDVPLPDEA